MNVPLPPLVRKILRVASGIVKDNKLPALDDGILQSAMKALSIFEAVHSEFGDSDADYARLREDGLVPFESEAFVRFFFDSRLKAHYQIQQKALGKRFQMHDARGDGQRLVFLQREGDRGGFEFESTVFAPEGFDFAALRQHLQSLYPHGLLLSTVKEDWRTRLVFLDVEPPDTRFTTSVLQGRVASLRRKMQGPASRGSFLFFGPIGTGKTLTTYLLGKATARWTLRVDATALQEIGLQEVDFLLRLFAPGILAIDDFDRVPDGRGNARLLLLLERIRRICPGTVTILSANDVKGIDHAALRAERIDEIVDFGMPTEAECDEILAVARLGDLTERAIRAEATNFNHANLARIVERVAAGENVNDALRIMGRLAALSAQSRAAACLGPSASPPA